MFFKMALVNEYILFKKDKKMLRLTKRNFIEKVLIGEVISAGYSG